MEADEAKFTDNNSEIIALAVQNQAGAQAMASRTGASYPILADPDHRIADAFGVFNLLNDGVATPAVFVINKSGEVVWDYVGKNINDRPPTQLILENLPPP